MRLLPFKRIKEGFQGWGIKTAWPSRHHAVYRLEFVFHLQQKKNLKTRIPLSLEPMSHNVWGDDSDSETICYKQEWE